MLTILQGESMKMFKKEWAKAAGVITALLVVMGSLANMYAGAWDGFTAPERLYNKVDIDSNVPIQLEDGTIIRADISYPAYDDGTRVAGKFPVIIYQTCYGKWMDPVMIEGGPLPLLANYPFHGYIQVDVDVRGTGSSEGEFGALNHQEKKDAYEIVEWVAKQDFCDGNIGVDGFSYLGASAALTATAAPPSLKAAVCGGHPFNTYRDFASQGGMWGFSSFLWLGLELLGAQPIPPFFTPKEMTYENFLIDYNALVKRTKEYQNSMPFRIKAVKGMINGTNDWDGDGSLWGEREFDPSKIEVPTLLYSGWDDLFLLGTPRGYKGMPLAPGIKQMLIGPWTHYSMPKSVGPENESNVYDVTVAWFDHWLKGIDNGIEKQGPVTLYNKGQEEWRKYDDWPLPGTKYTRLYLRKKKSGSADSINDGSLSKDPPTRKGKDRGKIDMLNGVGSRSFAQFSGGSFPITSPGAQDQQKQEKMLLTYTTKPFDTDVHIAGPVCLTIKGSSTAKDAAWVALLSDVYPEGRSEPMTQGALLASRRAIDPDRSVFSPNGDVVEPYHWHLRETSSYVKRGNTATFNVEIWPTSWVIKKRHRLRLSIAMSDYPHLMPSMRTWKTIGRQTVHYDPDEPSFLLIPLISPDSIE